MAGPQGEGQPKSVSHLMSGKTPNFSFLFKAVFYTLNKLQTGNQFGVTATFFVCVFKEYVCFIGFAI